MPRRRARIPLGVFLNGKFVGRLAREVSGAIDFQYDKSWLAWENALPVSLSLPLREDRYRGAPVMAVFNNLLPDHENIRRRLAARVLAEGDDAYSLLAALGRDCVGALQFLPDGTESGPAGNIEGHPLSNRKIAAILSDLNDTPLGVSNEGEFRISLAGAQEKTALLYWKDKWQLPSGQTATTHILKPPIGKRGNLDLTQSVENEHFCMTLTAALGLPTARTQIGVFGEIPTLVVERFDRRWTSQQRLLRLPQEDCCQALSFPPARKYESEGGPGIVAILRLLNGSDNPEHDRRIFLKAQMLFWLLGAIDGHAKNFSIYLTPGGRFRLAPLYDIMSAQPNLDAHQIRHNRMKLAMAVGSKRRYVVNTITPRHFMQSAETAGIPANAVLLMMRELIEQMPDSLEYTAQQMPQGFPGKLVKSIRNGVLQRLALIKNATEVG